MVMKWPKIPVIMTVFLLTSLIGFVGDFGALSFYFDSVLLEFIYGYAIYKLGARYGWRFLNLKTGIAVAAVAVVWLAIQDGHGSLGRGFGWRIPCAVVFVLVLRVEDIFLQPVLLKLSSLGDSSYSQYLVHTFIVPAVVVLLLKVGAASGWLCVVSSVLLSVGAGWLSYKYIEMPLIEGAKRRFGLVG